ncbi:MAG: Alpha-mannosidase [Ferruginibacter sp.]|nr:Alpha-mannosidase [Ferruginibacter sp.]
MKRMVVLLCALTCFSAAAQPGFKPEELVNTLMGTDSKYTFSNGNTYPAIALPWGMNFWTPQTNTNGNGWQYQYSADKIVGFKQTHQPSPWIGDYGQFSIMPMTGKLRIKEENRASWFTHKAEIATPYYYNVYLADYDLITEITPTERCAGFQFTFPAADSAYILVDAYDKGSYIKVIPEENKIIGYTTRNRGGVSANFKNYFIIESDRPFSCAYIIDDSVITSVKELTANHVQAAIGFSTTKGEKVHLKVASSFISFEQAELNLKREIGTRQFAQLLAKAKQAWNTELSKVKVEGGSLEERKTFYSCLYRMLLFPRKFYEIDATNQVVHYSPYNGNVEKGYMFTDTGFWDTFRALFPFLTIMYPELDSHIMEGLANTYKESGWLPEWASPGHRSSMVGSNSAVVIADAYLKGIRGYNMDTLYEALMKNTDNTGPISTLGRTGVKYYNQLGYVPIDVSIGGSAARTLEYAFDDFCLYELTKALHKPAAIIDKFAARSQSYRNLFDPARNLMRGKNQDGSFPSNFNAFRWGNEFVEGNAWHYSWSVFHDFNGLSKLMGGHKKMETMLDSVFILPPTFDGSAYPNKGGVIHEMTEMQVMNMGQYAHGNQPIQHMIYVYDYCGAPWKTQMHVRDAMNKLYKPTPDGYCGDEDNGQTSAWYVFSAMGFYPVAPGTRQYAIGAPLFKKITLSLENGNRFIIEAAQNNETNQYIHAAFLRGAKYDKNFLWHSDIMQGGTLQLIMHNTPNLKRGIASDAAPFSFSK